MRNAAKFMIVFVAIEHLWFLVLEMFLWTSATGLKTFAMTQEFANNSAVLAANQGLYNGILAAGLLWSAFATREAAALRRFFLGSVVVAGIYGGATAKLSILFIQAAPALIALVLSTLAARGAFEHTPTVAA